MSSGATCSRGRRRSFGGGAGRAWWLWKRLCKVFLGLLTTLVGGAKLEAYTPLRAMSAKQLIAIWEAVEADPSLQDKLRASIDGEIDTPLEVEAVLAIANDNGFSIAAVDSLKAEAMVMKANAQMILDLDDEEL